jgi:prevent-host-death family protein
METINIHAAKTNLSRLLESVAAGQEVVIAKAGKPIAKLVPIAPSPPPRQLGTLAGTFTVPDDFDDPLPDDVLDDFHGR